MRNKEIRNNNYIYVLGLIIIVILNIYLLIYAINDFQIRSDLNNHYIRTNQIITYKQNERIQNETYFTPTTNNNNNNSNNNNNNNLINNNNIDNLVDYLPTISRDKLDYFFSAIITREKLFQLSISIFSLSRTALRFNKGPNRIHTSTYQMWKDLELLTGIPRGSKSSDTIYCTISNGLNITSYTVKSIFNSTNKVLDSTGNDIIDIITCPMKDITNEFYRLSKSHEDLIITLFRESYSTKEKIIVLNFTIPWNTRRIGYMLTLPSNNYDINNKNNKNSNNDDDFQLISSTSYSLFNSWEGYPNQKNKINSSIINYNTQAYLAVIISNDRILSYHLGSASAPTVSNSAYLLEFIYHHISIGFKHIFLAVKYSYGSYRMKSLLYTLRHAIEEKYVTVISQSGDELDGTSSTLGLTWTEIFLKHYFHTIILYLLKGINYYNNNNNNNNQQQQSNYLAMWNIDSLLIPTFPYNNINNVIKNAQELHYKHLHKLYNKSDMKLLSFCYGIINSIKIIDKYTTKNLDDDDNNNDNNNNNHGNENNKNNKNKNNNNKNNKNNNNDNNDKYFKSKNYFWLKDRFKQNKSYFLVPNYQINNYTKQEIYQIKFNSIHQHGSNGTLYDDYGLILPINELLFGALPTSEECFEQSLIKPKWNDFIPNLILYRIMSPKYHYNLINSHLISATNNEYIKYYSTNNLKIIRKNNLDLMILNRLNNKKKLIGPKDEHWNRYISENI